MKKIRYISIPVVCAALLLIGCRQPVVKQTAPTSDSAHRNVRPAERRAAVAALSPSPDVTEADLLSAFGLTRGGITASAAAEKIRDEVAGGIAGLTFSERKIVSYDDEAGTFTVHVRGEKNGTAFDKKFDVTGFTHPYMGTQVQSVYENRLVFDQAIEENLPLTEFIDRANEAQGNGYLSLKLLLKDGREIEFGKHDGYSVTAILAKDDKKNNTVKIQAGYKILSKTLEDGKEEYDEKILSSYSLNRLINDSEKYFTEEDVLRYVFNKTNEEFVKVNSDMYPSYYYAMGKFGGVNPVEFDMQQIQKYIDLYKEANPPIEIRVGINNPGNDGIKANDFTGVLTVDYCIATATQLEKQSGIKHSKRVDRSGFRKIDSEDALKKHFTFTVTFKSLSAPDNETKWNEREIKNARLFYVNESGSQRGGVLQNPLPQNSNGKQNSYYLTGSVDDGLGFGNYGLSKDINDRQIYIENITLNKEAGSNALKITVQLCGGKLLDMTTIPFLRRPGY